MARTIGAGSWAAWLVLLVFLPLGAKKCPAQEPAAALPAGTAPSASLDGTWIFESAEWVKSSRRMKTLSPFWKSKITIVGDKITLTHLHGMARPLTGTLVWNANSKSGPIDIALDELDLTELELPGKTKGVVLPGIFEHRGGKWKLCFPLDIAKKARPSDFSPLEMSAVLVLTRIDNPAREFPKEIAVKVVDPQGQPVKGAHIFEFCHLPYDPVKKVQAKEWAFINGVQTGADGTVKIPYEKFQSGAIMARSPGEKQVGLFAANPASLFNAQALITLHPECTVRSSLDWGKESPKDKNNLGSFLLHWNSVNVCRMDSGSGMGAFPVPPGEYQIQAMFDRQKEHTISVTIKESDKEVVTKPIELTLSRLEGLRGQAAPPLRELLGWKGKPVKLEDLKGKYVLIDFWGYWCGPCVRSMPILIDLHEKYQDKEIVIIGIHMDELGDVDTAEKLDQKIAKYKEKLWGGRDLPFANALVAARERAAGALGPVSDYGINAFPTTILIDREGKVVSPIHFTDTKAAIGAMEKLLKTGKP